MKDSLLDLFAIFPITFESFKNFLSLMSLEVFKKCQLLPAKSISRASLITPSELPMLGPFTAISNSSLAPTSPMFNLTKVIIFI